jgi:hypothetical protein
LAFPKRASLIDTDDPVPRTAPQPARKLLVTTTNQAYIPERIQDILEGEVQAQRCVRRVCSMV